MLKIGMFDAKTHLPEIIRKVQAGEEICLTKHNEEVAFVIPVSKYYKNKNQALIQELINLKKKMPIGTNDEIISMRDEGRKGEGE